MPVKAVVPEREPAVAKATTVEHMSGSNPAAMEYGATTSECAAVNGRAATVVTASPTAAVTAATAAAMAATDFGRQPLRCMFSCGHRARIDQRQRLCTLARHRRQRKDRGGRKAQRTDKTMDHAAPGIWNLYHA
jgi:hypothetical protein